VTVFEHEDEPVHGLPALLPQGEQVLWQGGPVFGGLARRGFHVVGVGAYFLALALWRGYGALSAGEPLGAAALSFALPLIPGALAVGVLSLLAWLYARDTVYTITSSRVVVRTGLAITASVNIPFARVQGAALRRHGDGSGDLTLQLDPSNRVSWVLLWPNVRPWKLRQPEPMLRNLDDAEAVARILADALAASAPDSERAPIPVRVAPTAQGGLATAAS
jgi:hypothetical protein